LRTSCGPPRRFPEIFRGLAYQSSGLPRDSHSRLPYTVAMEVLS
jgi:hypothetical protein